MPHHPRPGGSKRHWHARDVGGVRVLLGRMSSWGPRCALSQTAWLADGLVGGFGVSGWGWRTWSAYPSSCSASSGTTYRPDFWLAPHVPTCWSGLSLHQTPQSGRGTPAAASWSQHQEHQRATQTTTETATHASFYFLQRPPLPPQFRRLVGRRPPTKVRGSGPPFLPPPPPRPPACWAACHCHAQRDPSGHPATQPAREDRGWTGNSRPCTDPVRPPLGPWHTQTVTVRRPPRRLHPTKSTRAGTHARTRCRQAVH